MTLYEEVHPEKYQGNQQVHQRFLARLKSVIPAACHVTVITDAGFRTDWFAAVQAQGWDFIGRIRSTMYYQQETDTKWQRCLDTYQQANSKARSLGRVRLAKARQLLCYLVLYQGLRQSNKNRRRPQKRSTTQANDYRRRNQEPWLLATSLEVSAQALIQRYAKRMSIEHEFRATKSNQWGLGLNLTRTRDPQRLALLLLIGHLAIMLLWMIGLVAEHDQRQYRYQANTVKSHRILSLVFLGLQIIQHEPHFVTSKRLQTALQWGKDDKQPL